MIASLYILQEALSDYLAKEGMDQSQLSHSLHMLCKQTMHDISLKYGEYSKTELAMQACNQCYVILVHLLDLIQQSTSTEMLIHPLQLLLQSFKLHYGLQLDPDNSLAIYEQVTLEDSIQGQLPELLDKLQRKGIPAYYLDELHYAMDSLFHPDKLPELKLYHQHYLPKFIGALAQLADDERDKDWPTRFVNILVTYNFNYMGFYNRWEKQQDPLLQEAMVQGTIEEKLLQLEMVLNRYSRMPNLSFTLHDKSLLHYMKAYLRIKKKQIKYQVEQGLLDNQSFILLNMNANEAKLLFHGLYSVKMFIASSKEEAAKYVAPNIRTRAGTSITSASLAKYDKEKLEAHAHIVIRKVKEMLKVMEDQFRS